MKCNLKSCTIKTPKCSFQTAREVLAVFQGQQFGSAGCKSPLPELASSCPGLPPGPARSFVSQFPGRGKKKGMLRPATWNQPSSHSATLSFLSLMSSWAGDSGISQKMHLKENSPERGDWGAVYLQVTTAGLKNTFTGHSGSANRLHKLPTALSPRGAPACAPRARLACEPAPHHPPMP